MRREEIAHRRTAWFAAHIIGACGMFKDKVDMKRLIANLNAPVDRKPGEMSITSVEDLKAYKEKYGLDLLPNG